MSIQIIDEYKRTISFEDLVKDIDSPLARACDNLSLEYWKEYCSPTQTFTIFAETKEELEEKTHELIHAVEMGSKNIIVLIDENDEITIEGFDLETCERSAKTHYEIHTCYGRKGKGLIEFVNDSLEANYIIFEDDDGVEMVTFFNTYEDIFGHMSDEDKKVYADDYKLNKEAEKYGVTEEKVYGKFTVLTRDFAEKYLKIED